MRKIKIGKIRRLKKKVYVCKSFMELLGIMEGDGGNIHHDYFSFNGISKSLKGWRRTPELALRGIFQGSPEGANTMEIEDTSEDLNEWGMTHGESMDMYYKIRINGWGWSKERKIRLDKFSLESVALRNQCGKVIIKRGWRPNFKYCIFVE